MPASPKGLILTLFLVSLVTLLTGCKSDPSPYPGRFEHEISQGASNTEAHYAALEPYLLQIEQSLPATSYSRNDLIPTLSEARRPIEWVKPETLRIKLYLGRKQEIFAPWLIAQSAGYFEEAGLEVEISESQRRENLYETLYRGDTDILIEPSAGNLIRKVAEGYPVVATQALFERSPFVFFTLDTSVPEDQTSSATLFPTAFKGSIVGLYNGHGFIPGILRDRWGVDPLGVKYLQWSNPNPQFVIETRTPFLECEIGFLTADMNRRAVKNWVSFPAETYVTPESSWLSVTRSEIVETSPDVIKRYNWAVFKALIYIMTQPSKSMPGLRDSITQKRSIKWLSDAWEARRPSIRGNSNTALLNIDQNSLNLTAAALLQQKLIEFSD